MANFVLVHGAWHGGWCYRDTAAALRAAGHRVLTPTHAGLGERAHQASPSITLADHVQDVVGCIEAEELDDVILCGHSYGGMVITGVADRIPDRIRTLVFLDAFVPDDGDSLISLIQRALPPEVGAQFVAGFRGAARENNRGMTAPIPAAMFNVKAENQPWVERRCVPQSLATFEMPLLLNNGGRDAVASRVFFLADGWDPSPFRYFADKYGSAEGWSLVKFPCGHDVMVDMPGELAAELARLA
ncbi:MAG: alpha/beta hydrolase [Burkholderiaceae bacterium]